MSDVAIIIKNVKKQYKLGAIGGQTLRAELQSWWARKRGLEDPNSLIGQDTMKYGEIFWALNGINLEIKKGEALGIIGGNGAGKSTLLKILSRVTAPTEGDIWIDGRISSMLEVGTGFHGELTGRENIYMNGAILGMSRKEVDNKIESIIDFSECRQFIDTPVKRYSSGMYVKLAFAVASHLDAEIMVMDEVLAVGDMAFQKKCLSKMGEEAKGGKTVLYVSHNMATIRKLCNRCIVLDKGQIIYDGSVESAIDLYINREMGKIDRHINFIDDSRKELTFGKKVFIEALKFLNEEGARINNSNATEIEIEWSAYQDVKDVYFRLTIVRADGERVGTVFSNVGLNGEANQKYKSRFVFDCTNLSEGLYSFYLLAYEINEFGTYANLDKPERKVYFEIYEGNNKITWNKEWWGHVKLNPLIFEDEK